VEFQVAFAVRSATLAGLGASSAPALFIVQPLHLVFLRQLENGRSHGYKCRLGRSGYECLEEQKSRSPEISTRKSSRSRLPFPAIQQTLKLIAEGAP
jgi:hypothetical protein